MPSRSNAGSHGKRSRTIMRSLKIQEISGVDVPAQESALAVIMKRKDDPDYDPKAKNPKKKKGEASQTDKTIEIVGKNVVLTSPEDGHSHLIQLDHGRGDLNAGETSWQEGHDHPWVRMGGGEIVIGTARRRSDGNSVGEPHIHRVAFTSKNDEDPETSSMAGVVGTTEEDDMSDKTKKTAEQTVEELREQLAQANLMASLTDAEKAHYDGLRPSTVKTPQRPSSPSLRMTVRLR